MNNVDSKKNTKCLSALKNIITENRTLSFHQQTSARNSPQHENRDGNDPEHQTSVES